MLNIRRLFSIAAVLAFLVPVAAQGSAPGKSIWLPEGFAYPNGIAFTQTGDLLVGSVVSGDIAALELGVQPAVRFAETEQRFAGTALRYDPDRGKLWVASPDFLGEEVNGEIRRRAHRLVVVDVPTGDVEWWAEMPDAGFANDIALDGTGGAFVTDTIRGRVLYLAAPGAPFEIVAEGLESRDGRLGPAGIAVDEHGNLIVGMYSDGRLVRVRPGTDGQPATIEEIELSAAIDNPDGMAFGPSGRLLVVDGAVATGNGKLVAVDLNGPSPHAVELVISGLDLPVNLTVRDHMVAISESRIRHRMVDDPTLLAPDRFRIVLLQLEHAD